MNGDSASVAVEIEGLNRAEMFDDAGEHAAARPLRLSVQHFAPRAESTRLE